MTSRFFHLADMENEEIAMEMKETGRNRLKREEEEESDPFCTRHS